jgi:hypothetical protein
LWESVLAKEQRHVVADGPLRQEVQMPMARLYWRMMLSSAVLSARAAKRWSPR